MPHEFASSPCYLHETEPLDDASAWDDVRCWRVQARAQLVTYRDSLSEQARTQSSDAIMQRLRQSDWLTPHERIGCYWPMPAEIDLRPLMLELIASGKTIALPLIRGAKQPLEFRNWHPDEALDDSGPWGIPAPAKGSLVAVTALLVPMLGFDTEGYRLGHGGGYYDRTLASMLPRPMTVGIAYAACRLRTIYPQAHDIPMDIIATDAQAD